MVLQRNQTLPVLVVLGFLCFGIVLYACRSQPHIMPDKVATFQRISSEPKVCPRCAPAVASGGGSTRRALPSHERRIYNFLPMLVEGTCGDALNLLQKQARDGELVIDVGSFDGDFAIETARRGYKVLALEPTPGKFERIQKKISKSGVSDKITFLQVAASNSSGTARFKIHGDDSQQDALFTAWDRDTDSVEVKVQPLDELVDEDANIKLLKIDTQGADFLVLLGSDSMLSQHRPEIIHIEFSPYLARSGGIDVVEMLEFIYDKGYKCFDCPCACGVKQYNQQRPSDFQGFAASFEPWEHRGANHGQWTDLVCF